MSLEKQLQELVSTLTNKLEMIKELGRNNPNDMDLGKKVRNLIKTKQI
jgi:hypothetical protein